MVYSLSSILLQLMKFLWRLGIKKDKSAGPNGIFMESLIYADNRLHVHLSLLFTFCLRHCCLPKACMDSVLMPLMKNKGGYLTDVDNYRMHCRMLKQRC